MAPMKVQIDYIPLLSIYDGDLQAALVLQAY